MTFADVLIPLPLAGTFTYLVPDHLKGEVEAGKRAILPFGKTRIYTGLIITIHDQQPEGLIVKEIISIIDEAPIIYSKNVHLWNWISEYYCCTPGDVMKAALPSALKMESHTKFSVNQTSDPGYLSPEETDFLHKFSKKTLTLQEIQKNSDKSFSFKILKKLIEKGFLSVSEELEPGFQPKTSDFISVNPDIKTAEDIELVKLSLGRAKKQVELFIHFITLITFRHKQGQEEITRAELLSGTVFKQNDLNGLIRKNILKCIKRTVSRLNYEFDGQTTINILNQLQQQTLEEIRILFKNKSVVLLHGVTASGKTEIYIHLISEILDKGQQVLYLVPEISITAQMIQRLIRAFGSKVGIYHSKLSDQERVETWNKVLLFRNKPDESYQVILGARSAVFLPFSDLGLVVVDEEHENSFKQFDPAPRYNARDLAIVLASFNSAKVILGSATPSFESLTNARSGKYGIVRIEKRHLDVELPEIIVADLREAYKKRQMKAMFTPHLYDKINEALENSLQVILFQNRRGYSPFLECMDCGWIPKCTSCDVSLTYHKQKGKMVCHYCGFSIEFPVSCPQCRSVEVKTRGFGTEKIESEVKKIFRNARIARMDLDTTHTKKAHEKLIRSLETHQTDILIGTQMVTKGFDFANVSLVGILNADNLMNFPDFRAYERAFQLLSQVSGRAGRREKRGMVVIQTTQPDHPVITAVRDQAFDPFLKIQLNERKLFNYPPFSRLIKIAVKHKIQEKTDRIAKQLADILRNERRIKVLGPESPLIGRIQNWHISEIWLKLPRTSEQAELKRFIQESSDMVLKLPDNTRAHINIDVDPM